MIIVRCLKPPKGAQKNARRPTVFRLKSHFAWRKSATKFLCVTTISDKVARHSLAYLSVLEWLVGGVPFYLKIRVKLTAFEQNRLFSIYFGPYSA